MTRPLDVGDCVASISPDWRWLGFGRVTSIRDDGRRTVEWDASIRTHESPDRLLLRSEVEDKAAIDAIMVTPDDEIVATSEPDAAERVQRAFERAKEDVQRRGASTLSRLRLDGGEE